MSMIALQVQAAVSAWQGLIPVDIVWEICDKDLFVPCAVSGTYTTKRSDNNDEQET